MFNFNNAQAHTPMREHAHTQTLTQRERESPGGGGVLPL